MIGESKRGLLTARVLLGVLLAVTVNTGVGYAEEGWEFVLGIGAYGSNVYTGSGDYFVLPIPVVETTYAYGDLSVSFSVLNGLGVTYFDPTHGVLASVGVRFGEERDSEVYTHIGVPFDHRADTRDLLRGSPTASTALVSSVTAGYLTPVGIVGLSVGYWPTTLDYDGGGADDTTKHGLLFSAVYLVEVPLTERLSVGALLSLELMNDAYADGWYSVRYPTARLGRFDAGTGLKDTQLALEVKRMFSEHLGASLLAAGTVLLADAYESPFTTERLQASAVLSAFYSF